MLGEGRRLGLVLSGGGSHGAWQAGCVKAFREAGLRFDRFFGFSIGSVTGAAAFLGMDDVLIEHWRRMEELRLFRFGPRLNAAWVSPLSLYSDAGVREVLRLVPEDAEAKRRARGRLTIATHRVRDAILEYPTFAAEGPWDGPLARQLAASCAVPWVFPPVRIPERGGKLYVDGGVPGREPMRFDAVADCEDVIVVMMVRPEESGRAGLWLRRRADQVGREMCLRQMSAGIADLLARPKAPRIFKVIPSAVLEYDQLDFSPKVCVPALEQGTRDGQAFLRDFSAAEIAAPA